MNKRIDAVRLIKDRINIVDILEKDLRLIKSGSNYKALCPFHKEKTPSFVVNVLKQSYACYGCGKNGDIFSYVMEKYKVDFKEALKMLAEEANVEIDNNSYYKQSENSRISSKTYFKVMHLISSFYKYNLKEHLKYNNINFLKEKNISAEKIDIYDLGLSKDSKSLENFLTQKSISLEYLLANNILKLNKYNKTYDLFTDRLMFPIKDKYENIMAFGGRTLKEQQPKYINSWENNFFKKREILYNLPCLNRIKSRSNEIYLVEGYTDVIAMESIGLKAVAPLGTSLTLEQFKLIWKYVNEPILIMDGDKAGINASYRAIDLVIPEINPQNTLNFVFLKDGKDPDDIINDKNQSHQHANFFKERSNFLETLMNSLVREDALDSPERIINSKNNILEKIKLIKDNDTRALYRAFIFKRFNQLSKNQIINFGYTSTVIKKDNYFTKKIKNKKPESFIIKRERSILAAMLNNLNLLKRNDEILAKVHLSDSELEKIRNAIIDILSNENILKSEDLKRSLINKGFDKLLRKHFQTEDCINFDLVEEYAKENSDIEYATETLLNLISIQEKWYKSKNKTL